MLSLTPNQSTQGKTLKEIALYSYKVMLLQESK